MSDLLNVLIVDDDDVDRMAVRRSLRAAGLAAQITEAASIAAAVTKLNDFTYDCIFLDFNLPDGTGLEVLRRIQRASFRAPVIVLTGQGDEETAVELMKAGAADYIVKSAATPDRMRTAVPAVLRMFRAEQGLKEAEERLRLAIEAAAIGTWDYQPLANVLTWSERSKEFFGIPPHASVDFELFLTLVHPLDREHVERMVNAALDPAGTGEFDAEYRVVSPNRSVRWVHATGRAIFHGEGAARKAVRFIGTVTDRTQQRESEEHLRRYAAQLRALAETSLSVHSTLSTEAVLQLITDKARAIVGAHQAVASMTVNDTWAQAINAVSLSEKYEAYRDFAAPPDGSGIYAVVCESNRPMRLTQAELEAHPRWQGFGAHAGDHPPMRGWLAVPMVAREGSNLGVIQLSDRYEGDFTPEDEAILVQLAQLASVAIENARLFEEAQAAIRAREDVLAIVSHDLRNPLNTLIASASIMTDLPLTPAQEEQQLEIIKRTGHQMNRLLQDLLDVSSIDAGRFKVEPTANDPRIILAETCATFERHTAAKDQTIICDIPENLPPIFADRDRLGQVFGNLISNAIRFAPRGGIIRIAARDHNGFVEFAVADNGTGIPAEDLPHIFERFWQARRARRMGAGLGLAIVKGIVEAHGGSVSVQSIPNTGTTFYFTIPVMPFAAEMGSSTVSTS